MLKVFNFKYWSWVASKCTCKKELIIHLFLNTDISLHVFELILRNWIPNDMERTFHQIERPDVAGLHYYNRNISEKSSVTKHSNSVILQNSL